MKKTISAIMIAVYMLSIGINVQAQDIVVEVDGRNVNFDQPPVIQEGRTLVPMRAVFEALGAEVSWDGVSRTATATKENTTISIGIDNNYIEINGELKTLDVPAKIINDRTMVPVRAVSEAFDCNVDWDGANQRVIVITDASFTSTTVSDTSTFYVHYIDVGQADCALVLCDGKSMLIDGGNAEDSNLVVSYLQKQSVNYLDYIICTHAHEDHVGGLSGPLSVMNAGQVFAPITETDTKAYSSFKTKTAQQGLKIVHPHTGDTLALGSSTVEFITPTLEDSDDLNNTSIMCKISYGNTSFLFTGDAEYEEEQNIMAQNVNLDADVLKVGHHGSDTSTSYVFLREIMPKYAVISVGEGNSYGHPTDIVLSRLHDAGATVYRTDLNGDVIAKSDGNNITFTTSENSEMIYQAVEIQYIGNKNTKKLHLSSCSSLPKEENREYFTDRDDAVADGFEPCKNCKP